MARKVGKRDSRYIAKLITENRAPCAFCRREVDDEVTYGNLYAIGDIQCHYFCALLSCCLVQKGPEEDGLFGFMYKDILAELERSKKHKCSFCGSGGANLGCSVSACRKQFHLPCGRERRAVSLYYGTYKSFCQVHAPKQKLPEHIMSNVRLRMKRNDEKKIKRSTELVKNNTENADDTDFREVCVICYEAVEAFPTVDTFWPPCCARDAWFHRSCLQRMALSAGMHYLKCPLCNDKQNFYEAVLSQGYYVPDRDAAWELEQNAFAEIYERPLTCAADMCHCPSGREHDADQGMWDIKLCLLCGSVGAHAQCVGASETTRYVCVTCTPAAPQNMDELAATIDKMILQEQAQAASTTRLGPVMPSRMSLRRTKGRSAILDRASSSRARYIKTECELAQSPNTQSSREELNLKTPRRLNSSIKNPYNSPQRSYKTSDSPRKSIHSPYKIDKTTIMENSPKKCSLQGSYKHTILSPMKLLENSFREKVKCMGVTNAILDEKVISGVKQRFRRPRPYSEKIKFINDILDDIFKHKEPLREWCSPKKCYDIAEELETQTTGDNALKPKENKENSCTPKKSTSLINTTTANKITSTSKTSRNIKALDFSPKNDVLRNENDLFNEMSETNDYTPDKIYALKDKLNVSNDKDSGDDVIHAEAIDDSSNSTFELPSEFIAGNYSDTDESFKGFSSPKSKTIDIKQDSSLEISELDQTINIDVIHNDPNISNEMNSDKTREIDIDRLTKSAFKFSPLDKEKLEKNKLDIDLENFKKEYLNEVDKAFKCTFNHKHDTDHKIVTNNLKSTIDFAVDALEQKKNTDRKNGLKGVKRGKKRKMVLTHNETSKVKKISEDDLNSHSSDAFEVKTINPPKGGKQDQNIICNKKEDDNRKKQHYIEKKKRRNAEMCKNRRLKSKRKRLEGKKDLRDTNKRDVKPSQYIKTVKGNVEDNKDLINKKQNDDKEIQSKKVNTKEKQLKYKERKAKREEKYRKNVKRAKQKDENIEVTFDSSTSKSKKKTKLSISNNRKDISVKIKWKNKQMRLKIESNNDKAKHAKGPTTTKLKKLDSNSKHSDTKFKQYVLQYFSEVTPNEVLLRPDKEVSPLKRKYVKQVKTPDNLKQTSIQNFFIVKSPHK